MPTEDPGHPSVPVLPTTLASPRTDPGDRPANAGANAQVNGLAQWHTQRNTLDTSDFSVC